MKKINIEITKAQITSFQVTLGEDKPEVSATIALLNNQGKEITHYSISTTSWEKEKQFDLPVGLIKPILMIMAELETILVKHCNNSQKQLAERNN